MLGFVSRIAPEKNMEFLVSAVKRYLERNDSACFLLVGSGHRRTELSLNLWRRDSGDGFSYRHTN